MDRPSSRQDERPGPAGAPAGVGRFVALALVLLAIAGLVGLGVWQLQRRTWKLALIAQVEQRLAAPPVAAPGPALWPDIDRNDAYARVVAHGRWRATDAIFVQAVTGLGGGYWVLAPFDTDRGFTLFVNRGFVPPERRDAAARAPAGPAMVTGLLRVSEPGGAFLRDNDPAAGRWYSRDVRAMAAARGLGPVAPYFIDADAAPGAAGWPRGGLTVVRFPNNHLVYALTWFAMAGLLAAATWRLAARGHVLRTGRGRS